LREFQTGEAEERAVLEWLAVAELSVSDYLRLLDYGSLRGGLRTQLGLRSRSRRRLCGVLSLEESKE